jgi:hypothetical protein
LAVAAIALAAPMVAAEPASAPVQPTVVPALPAEPVAATVEADAANEWRLLAALAKAEEVKVWEAAAKKAAAAEAAAKEAAEKEAAAQRAAEEQAAAEAAAARAATTTAPPPPPAAPSGRCGGDLPPCWVMMRESGGNITAKNPSSSASGKWQFINSTWDGFGGYAEAWMAPESVQDDKARQLWAGGSGCGHWSAC